MDKSLTEKFTTEENKSETTVECDDPIIMCLVCIYIWILMIPGAKGH